MAAEFHSEAKLPSRFIPDVWESSWSGVVGSGAAAVLIDEDEGEISGTIGFFVYKDMNDGDLVAVEAFWFVKKFSRGAGLKLLKTAERHLRMMGCKRIHMVHLAGLNSRLGGIYKRFGYTDLEHTFVKEL